MNFKKLLKSAVADMVLNGFDSQMRVNRWLTLLKLSLIHEVPTQPHIVRQKVEQALTPIFNRTTVKLAQRSTIDRVRPELRGELTRRIEASANLIKLNREEMVDRTLKRFSGWTTSVPANGSTSIDTKAVVSELYKPLRQQSYEERRVAIDQGHKLIANVNYVIAQGSNAIAARWDSRWRQKGYDYREDHKDRDGEVYLLRGCQAEIDGLVKPDENGYFEAHEMPGSGYFAGVAQCICIHCGKYLSTC
jgi:hypothetical protein